MRVVLDALTLPRRATGHILRLLATTHWIREVKPDVFANNRLSALVDSGKTLEELRAAYVELLPSWDLPRVQAYHLSSLT